MTVRLLPVALMMKFLLVMIFYLPGSRRRTLVLILSRTFYALSVPKTFQGSEQTVSYDADEQADARAVHNSQLILPNLLMTFTPFFIFVA